MSSQPITETLISADDLMVLEGQGKRYEVWEGELQEKAMATLEHAEIAANLIMLLRSFVKQNQCGKVFDGSVTYVLKGTRQRLERALMPDLSFIQTERLVGVESRDFAYLPPDMAIEIISSSERPSEVLTKVGAYLEFGVQEIWVIYPTSQKVVIYRPDQGHPNVYGVGDEIAMQGPLKGLAIPVKDIFAG